MKHNINGHYNKKKVKNDYMTPHKTRAYRQVFLQGNNFQLHDARRVCMMIFLGILICIIFQQIINQTIFSNDRVVA